MGPKKRERDEVRVVAEDRPQAKSWFTAEAHIFPSFVFLPLDPPPTAPCQAGPRKTREALKAQARSLGFLLAAVESHGRF